MIKVGICGFGYWGPNLLRNFATNPGFCPVAVAERREAYRTNTGGIGFRCPAEPVSAYLSKGGALEETAGRKCVCNGLMANIGLGQVRGRGEEAGLVTSGDDLVHLGPFMRDGTTHYTAADVVNRLLGL